MALGIEEGLLAYALYHLWKKKRPPSATKVNWPKEGQGAKVALSPEDKASIAQNEAEHAAEVTKFKAQVAAAKAKAGHDKAAQADIARRAKERQKALDDWQRDINAAKRGEGRG